MAETWPAIWRQGIFLFLLTAFLAVGPTAAAQGTDPSPDVVRLHFDWPLGLRTHVESYQRQVRQAPGRSSDLTVQSSYSMSVAPHSEGIVVRHSDFRTIRFESVPAIPEGNPMRLLYDRLASVRPNYVVSDEGELLRVDGMAEIAGIVQQTLDPLLDTLPAQAASLGQVAGQMLSEEALFENIAEQWNAMVGAWIGAEFEVGAAYVLEEEVPTPLFPDLKIPMLYVFSIVERTSCVGGGSPDCVRMTMDSYPEPEATTAFLQEFMRRAGQGIPNVDMALGELIQRNTVEVVANPDTLLPYRLEITRDTGGSVTSSGQSSGIRRVDQSRYEFHHQAGN